jgi:hypothetical protein
LERGRGGKRGKESGKGKVGMWASFLRARDEGHSKTQSRGREPSSDSDECLEPRTDDRRRMVGLRILGAILLDDRLDATFLLRLELVVQEEEGLLVVPAQEGTRV